MNQSGLGKSINFVGVFRFQTETAFCAIYVKALPLDSRFTKKV